MTEDKKDEKKDIEVKHATHADLTITGHPPKVLRGVVIKPPTGSLKAK